MATLLANYDMKNIGTERYANLEFGEIVSPFHGQMSGSNGFEQVMAQKDPS
jgi:hypothetical protein